MIRNVVTYPRGFQGFDIGIPIVTKGDSVKQTIKNVSYNRTGQDLRFVISNKNIETLWSQLTGGSISIQNFDVREKILNNALSAFGTESFLEWILLQESNPNLTDMHRRFINDTLNFITTGKRAMNVQTWGNLIRVRDVTSRDSTPEIVKDKFFNLSQPIQFRNKGTFVEVLPRWVVREGGFADLACTLHVFFGDYES